MIENEKVVIFDDILQKSETFSLFAWGSALEAVMLPKTTVHDVQPPLLNPVTCHRLIGSVEWELTQPLTKQKNILTN